jgi:pyrroloquinoline quinone (PQQ) biosynthesis protein C
MAEAGVGMRHDNESLEGVMMKLKDYVISENKAVVRDNVVLAALREKTLDCAQFKLFAAQRAYVATNFVRLVKKAMEMALAVGDTELAAALRANLDDELGIGPDGLVNPELNHLNWKIVYLDALGLEADVSGFPLLEATRAHVDAFLEQEERGTLFSIAGTLLSLENIIPLEYRSAVIARDHLFPDIFCDEDKDTDDMRRQKQRARQYLDDHILHDSKSHFPDLLRALLKYECDPFAMAELKRGIDVVNTFRQRFYTGLHSALRFGPEMMEFYTFGN